MKIRKKLIIIGAVVTSALLSPELQAGPKRIGYGKSMGKSTTPHFRPSSRSKFSTRMTLPKNTTSSVTRSYTPPKTSKSTTSTMPGVSKNSAKIKQALTRRKAPIHKPIVTKPKPLKLLQKTNLTSTTTVNNKMWVSG